MTALASGGGFATINEMPLIHTRRITQKTVTVGVLPTVFLCIGNRAFASDLLRTSYIKALVEKFQVIVVLPKSWQGSSDYLVHERITYRFIEEPRGKFWTLFDTILRSEMIRTFDNNVAVLWRNRRANDRRRRLVGAFARLFPKSFFTPSLFTAIETYLVPNAGQCRALIQEFRPVLILVPATGWHAFDAYFILCARRFGIPSVAVNPSWDNFTNYPRHLRKTDYVICWNERNRQEAMAIAGYTPERLFVGGIMRFDAYFKESGAVSRAAFLESKGLDPNRKTLLYAAKSHGTFPGDFISSFLHWQEAGELHEPLNLLVRMHPVDPMTQYAPFVGKPFVHIERPSETIRDADERSGHKVEMGERDIANMKYTLRHTDICVNISSTVSIEAMIFGKPVINIGFVPEFSEILTFPHYRPLIEHHSVVVAQNMDAVRDAINRYLADPSHEAEGRAWVLKNMVVPTDGYSYQRGVDFLDTILQHAK